MDRLLCHFTFLFFLLGSPLLCAGKVISFINNGDAEDSSHIASFDQKLILRSYLSQKYTSINISGSNTLPPFKYRPNTTLNWGVGATLKSLSLNLAYGFQGLNRGATQKGETKYLDLQSHVYKKKWVLDLFAQLYNGYYIAQKDYVPGYPAYYSDRGLKVRLFGISGYHIFNYKKFSYRATLIQDEWQKKSAGTFLAGFDFSYGLFGSDKSIIPTAFQTAFPQGNVQKLRFFNFGPGVGYAYTFVYKKHWFATGSLTASITADFSKELGTTSFANQFNFSSNLLYRAGAGYNAENWTLVFSLVNSSIRTRGASTPKPYLFKTGNYRLTFAHRLTLGEKTNKKLERWSF